jgi:hypothetical protein
MSNIIHAYIVWTTHLNLAQGLRISEAVPILPPIYRPSLCEQGQLYNTVQLMHPRPESGCSTTDEETRYIFCT